MTKRKTLLYHVARATMTLLVMLLTTATAWADDGVKYLDENGVEQTCTSYTVLTGSEESISGGWYVVNSNITFNHNLYIDCFSSPVNLILADDTDITITDNMILFIGTLTIYVQSNGINQGSIHAKGIKDDEYVSHLIINGGSINADGNGIYAKELTINGGIITTNCDLFDYDNSGIDSQRTTINGGSVNASGKNYGISAVEGFTINGGDINASGESEGIFSNPITLAGGSVKANSYSGTVTIAEGFKYTDGSKSSSDFCELELTKTLRPVISTSYIDEDKLSRSVEAIVLTGSASTESTELPGGCYVVTGSNICYNGTLEFSGDVNLILADGCKLNIGTKASPISSGRGIDAKGDLTIYGQSEGEGKGSLTIYAKGFGIDAHNNDIIVNGGNISAISTDEYRFSDYFSDGITTYGNIIINGGTLIARALVNSILADKNIVINGGSISAIGNYYGIHANGDITIAASTIEAGGNNCIYAGGNISIESGTINVIGNDAEDGIYAGGDITIEDGTVTVRKNDDEASDADYAISANGTINITDGTVEANGYCCGIYADYVTIEGGEIYATGLEDGIHASIDISINGGIVTINSQENGEYPEAGIFAYGIITINGGTVISNGSDFGIGTNIDDGTIILAGATVTASSFSAATVAIADDIKYNYDGIETPLEGELTDLDDIKGKKLTAIMPTKYEPTAKPVDGNYWSTFYFGSMGFTIDGDNACAYTATYGLNSGTNEYELTLNKLGKDIPQGTAVIIVSSTASVSLTKNDNLGTFSGSNSLRGVDVRTDMSTLGTGTFYVMGKKDNNFGFFKYTADYMPARKAFLLIDDSNEALARGISMVFDDATGIRSIDKGQIGTESDAWYSLDGRKLLVKPTTKGVYINNGNKVIIK